MKKFLSICILAFALSGCVNGRLPDIFKPTANPISNNTLAGAIAAYGIADTALIAYRGLPRCTITNNFSATNICYKRSVLVAGQNLDKKANDTLNKAVDFQRDNPTLDASSYVNAAIDAVNIFKSFTVDNGLPGAQ